MTNSKPAYSTPVYAIHGFLGLPTDWQIHSFVTHPVKIEEETLPFWKWAKTFNQRIHQECPGNKVLIGYSLGGRLAMHALLQKPDIWEKAILISANPGLDSKQMREKRKASDAIWAEKFLKDSWDSLMGEWDSMPIFGGRKHPLERKEEDFDRKRLAKELVNWSLGNQDSLYKALQSLSIPILYIAGEKDTMYSGIARELSDFAEIAVVPESSHRVPWEQPEQFQKVVQNFLTVSP